MQVNVTRYQIKDLIEQAKKPLVVLGAGADNDTAALAAVWFEIFETYDKPAILVSQSALPAGVEALVKKEQIKNKVEAKSLVISLDWIENKLDKVSYDIDANKFNLIINSHGAKIDPSQLDFSYRGQDFDLLITVGVDKVEDLFALGIDNDVFLSLPSINWSRKEENTSFAKVNIVDKNADSLCSLGANIFKAAGVNLPIRAAEALMFGMRAATENFTRVNNPETFEAAAVCKRAMIPGLPTEEKKEAPQKKVENEEKAAESWLSPKIFRSSRLS